jgi:hypothetical protein
MSDHVDVPLNWDDDQFRKEFEKDLAAGMDLNREIDSVAQITARVQRELAISRLAELFKGKVKKSTITELVQERIAETAKAAAEMVQQVRQEELKAKPIDTGKLIDDLEAYFAERAYLPEGAPLLLAYFVLNSYVYEICDTTPYLSLESAVPGCGKSTVLALINAVGCRARKATSMSEAALYRIIDAEKPLLMIDEARILETNSDRGDLLKAVLHEGYKKGGQVPRCEGDDNDIRWFDVYGPKAIAEIGGLTGALLDRCIVIHMEKAPRGHRRKSTRIRALKRDSASFVKALEAYAVQTKPGLTKLYDEEPDQGYWPQLEDREAELYGPLLIHAKLIGAEAEAKLLAVVDRFTSAKADIKAEDLTTAKAIALLDVVEQMSGETVTPGDLVDSLAEYEAWAVVFGSVKGDEKTKH